MRKDRCESVRGETPPANPADPTIEVAGLRGGRPRWGRRHEAQLGVRSCLPDRPDLPARVSEERFPARGRVRRFSHLDAAAAAHRSRPVCAGSWRSNLGVCCFGMWPLASGAEGPRRDVVSSRCYAERSMGPIARGGSSAKAASRPPRTEPPFLIGTRHDHQMVPPCAIATSPHCPTVALARAQ